MVDVEITNTIESDAVEIETATTKIGAEAARDLEVTKRKMENGQSLAVLEWILNIKWHCPSARFAAAAAATPSLPPGTPAAPTALVPENGREGKLAKELHDNLASRLFDQTRESSFGRWSSSPLVENSCLVPQSHPSKSWPPQRHDSHASSSSDFYVPLINVCKLFDGGDESGLPLEWDNFADLLKTTVLEQCRQHEKGAKVLQYLSLVYRRANANEITRSLVGSRTWKQLERADPSRFSQESLSLMQDTCVNYAILLFLLPEMFLPETAPPKEALLHSLYTILANNHASADASLEFRLPPTCFEQRLLKALAENEEAAWVREALLSRIYEELRGRRVSTPQTSAVNALLTFVNADNLFAEEVTDSGFFLLEGRGSGWTIMSNTIFGRLLGLQAYDDILIGDERRVPSAGEFPTGKFQPVTEKYFRKSLDGSRMVGNPRPALKELRSALSQGSRVAVCFVKTVCKASLRAKFAMLNWFATVLELNERLATAQHRHILEPLATLQPPMLAISHSAGGISTPAFLTNVIWVLLELAKPISMDAINKIDPLYPHISASLDSFRHHNFLGLLNGISEKPGEGWPKLPKDVCLRAVSVLSPQSLPEANQEPWTRNWVRTPHSQLAKRLEPTKRSDKDLARAVNFLRPSVADLLPFRRHEQKDAQGNSTTVEVPEVQAYENFAQLLDANFMTQIFWLTLKACRICLFQIVTAHEHLTKIIVKHFESGMALPNASQKIEDLTSQYLVWNAQLMYPDFVLSVCRFVELASGQLLMSFYPDRPINLKTDLAALLAFRYDAESAAKVQLKALNPDVISKDVISKDVISKGEGSEKGSRVCIPRKEGIPWEFYGDMYESFNKLMRISCQPLLPFLQNPTLFDTAMTESECEYFAAALLRILGDRPADALVPHATFKLETTARILTVVHLLPHFGKRFDATRVVSSHIALALVHGFCDAQQLPYYLRLEMRLTLLREMHTRLESGTAFAQCLRRLAQVSPHQPTQSQGSTVDSTEILEKFLHYFASSTSWLLEEALSFLTEIKRRESSGHLQPLSNNAGGSGGSVNGTIESANSLSGGENENETDEERERRETERLTEALDGGGRRELSSLSFPEVKSQCRNLMDAGSFALEVFSKLPKEIFQFITNHSAILLSQTVLYMNSCLNSLVGPRCLELKVSNFSAYNFKPREFLAGLLLVFDAFYRANAEKTLSAIVKEERYFSAALFAKAQKIAKREGILSRDELDTFSSLQQAITEAVAQTESFSKKLLMTDIPDEFYDPILSELMTEPVLLPTSGMICDRHSIERHLLEDAFDPFNREPLTRDQLQPQPELKERIEKFLADLHAED